MFLNNENRLSRRLISGCENPKYLEIKFMFFLILMRALRVSLFLLLSFLSLRTFVFFKRIEQNFVRPLKPTYLRKRRAIIENLGNALIQNYIIRW